MAQTQSAASDTEKQVIESAATDMNKHTLRAKAEVMTNNQSNDPLHNVTLEKVVTRLMEHYGWDGLSHRVSINCFKSDPSIRSSLKFLRKTPWARDKVEALYISTFQNTPPETDTK